MCSEGEWCGKGVESSSPGTCPLLATQGSSATSLGSMWPPRWLQGSKRPPVCFSPSDALQLRVCHPPPSLYHLFGA